MFQNFYAYLQVAVDLCETNVTILNQHPSAWGGLTLTQQNAYNNAMTGLRQIQGAVNLEEIRAGLECLGTFIALPADDAKALASEYVKTFRCEDDMGSPHPAFGLMFGLFLSAFYTGVLYLLWTYSIPSIELIIGSAGCVVLGQVLFAYSLYVLTRAMGSWIIKKYEEHCKLNALLETQLALQTFQKEMNTLFPSTTNTNTAPISQSHAAFFAHQKALKDQVLAQKKQVVSEEKSMRPA